MISLLLISYILIFISIAYSSRIAELILEGVNRMDGKNSYIKPIEHESF